MKGSGYKRVASLIYRHDLKILAAVAVLSLLSVLAVRQLPLHGDLASLLPDDRPSVIALRKVVQKLGGSGQLLILATPPDPKTGELFVDAVGPEIAKSELINNVDYRRDLDFFERHRFLLVNLADLRDIRDRLSSKLAEIKKNYLPFVMKSFKAPDGTPRVEVIIKDEKMNVPAGALEREFKKLRSSFEDIENKYKMGSGGDYFASESRDTYMLALYPKGQATDVEFAKKMLAEVDQIVRRVNEERFGGAIKIEYGGTFKNAIDDYETVVRDVERATLITATFLILLLTLMFRQPLIVFVLGLPQVMAVLWTFACAYLFVGSLNVFTVFLFNILFGIGIEFGIQMYSRYAEERSLGTDVEVSLGRVLAHTWTACFTAATVAGFAFFSLMITQFKGFSEFGFISGLGIFLALLAMVIGFCPLVVRLDKLGWLRFADAARAPRPAPRPLGDPSIPFMRPILIGTVAVVALCLFGARGISFDYDLSKLKAANPEVLKREARIAKVFHLSLTPAAIIAPDKKRLSEVTSTLKARANEKKNGTIDVVRSIESVMPPDQAQRLHVISQIRALLNDELFKLASPEQRREIDHLKASMKPQMVRLKDIPNDLQWKFHGKDEPEGYLAYVYPSVSMDHGESVIAFSNDVDQIPTSLGVLRAASPQLIIGDMLKLMIRDGKIAVVITFLSVFLVLWIDFRSIKHTLILLLPVSAGVAILLGVMAIFKIKFDFYNMIAMPTVLGLGINNAIYLYHRYREEGPGRLRVVMRNTGVAVFITATAMIIGFSGLLFAEHPGLRSIGLMAVLGILTVLICLLTFFPAFLQLLESRRLLEVPVRDSHADGRRLRG
jgi:predicted RND superfamily exporter protein